MGKNQIYFINKINNITLWYFSFFTMTSTGFLLGFVGQIMY